MPVPRHSVMLPSVQLGADAGSGGVTELRVHGVGGSPPDATLGDLAPEQVMGDAIAGFYRTSDHKASPEDRDARRDVDRHVEVYSWGGLTSRSKIRVLWLALLPFMFANLAGWMCSASTRKSAWRLRLHRLAAGLGGLALTVNAALIAVPISADVVAYQTARAKLSPHQWWLAPLNWYYVKNHPGRQGAVLATAALVQTACRPEGDHPALITFGSPVCKLYGWAFPAYFDRALLEPLAPGQAARVNDWRNFFYPTDPIGGSVAPELSAVGGDPVDTEFLDPAHCYYVYGQPPPASTGHSGYWADRRVWDVINSVAAGLPGGPDDISPERVQQIVHGPEASAPLAVGPDRGGETVEVPAAEEAGPVDGDDGQVGG